MLPHPPTPNRTDPPNPNHALPSPSPYLSSLHCSIADISSLLSAPSRHPLIISHMSTPLPTQPHASVFPARPGRRPDGAKPRRAEGPAPPGREPCRALPGRCRAPAQKGRAVAGASPRRRRGARTVPVGAVSCPWPGRVGGSGRGLSPPRRDASVPPPERARARDQGRPRKGQYRAPKGREYACVQRGFERALQGP